MKLTMSDDEREEKELDLSNPEVVTKYKNAAEIINSVFHSLSLSLSLSRFEFYICSCFLMHWIHNFHGFWLKFTGLLDKCVLFFSG